MSHHPTLPQPHMMKELNLRHSAILEACIEAIDGQKDILKGYLESVKEVHIKDLTYDDLKGFMDICVMMELKIYEEKVRLQKEV